MSDMQDAKLVSIVYKPESNEAKPEGRYLRVPLQTANLVVGHGIEGDRKGGHPRRQLNIMSAETLNTLAGEGYNIEPGQMGEQMVVSGLDVDTLPVGTLLQLGDTAIIEVTIPREGCDRFEAIQGFPREKTTGRVGIMARVVESGQINIGDSVRIVQSAG